MYLPAGCDVVQSVHGHVKGFEELVVKDSFCLGAHLIRLCFDVHARVHSESHVTRNNRLGFLNQIKSKK